MIEKKWFKRVIGIHLSEESHVLEINGRKFGLSVRYGVDGEIPLKKVSWPMVIHLTDGSTNRKLSFTAKFPDEVQIIVDNKILYEDSPSPWL